MTATDTVIPARSTRHQGQRPAVAEAAAAASDTPTTSPPAVNILPTDPHPTPGWRRRGTRLPLRLAAVALAAAVAVALTTLGFTVPDHAEVTTLHGPALTAAVVGMSSAVLGFLLTFLAAVRSDR